MNDAGGKISARIAPFKSEDGEYELFLPFMEKAVVHLDPGFAPPRTVISETSDESPYEYSVKTILLGDRERHWKVVLRSDYVEMGAASLTADTVELAAIGIAGGESLALRCVREPGQPKVNRELSLELECARPAADAIIALFTLAFGDHYDGDSPDPNFAPAGAADAVPDKFNADLDSHAASAMANLARGRYDLAKRQARHLLKYRPLDLRAKFILAVCLCVDGDYDGAEPLLREVTSQEPGNYDAWFNLGRLYQERKDWARALGAFERGLASDAANHVIRFFAGECAAALGDAERAKRHYLVSVETDPNPGDAWGYRGMNYAEKAREALKKMGVDPAKEAAREFIFSGDGTADIFRAAEADNEDAVAKLLSGGVSPAVINEDGLDLISVASMKGAARVVELLLDRGVNVDNPGRDGWTPLIWAASLGHGNVVALLIGRGADVNFLNGEGCTALWWAACGGNLGAVTALLGAGAEPELAGKEQITPLRIAARHDRVDVCEELESAGASWKTPEDELIDRVMGGNVTAVTRLLKAGVSPNLENDGCETLLESATRLGYGRVAELLKKYGAMEGNNNAS